MKQEIKLTDEVLLSIPQVANLLHTNTARVYSYCKAGLMRPLKLGEMKVRREEVDRFLRENEGKDLSDPENVKELIV